MKYGFFGGSFNPPTCAHLELVKQAKEKFELDRIFFVPVGNFYKKANLIDEKHRYQMLKIICKNYDYLEVSDIEMNTNKEYKAIDVFEIITDKYKKEIEQNKLEIYFIIGSDNLAKIDTWKSSDELIRNYKYIVLEREHESINRIFSNSELLKDNRNNFFIINNSNHNNISSTIVRENIKNNQSDIICDMIPEEVYDYILENRLYI